MRSSSKPLNVMQVLDSKGVAGIERHVLTLAEELIAQGVSCEIVTSGENALSKLALAAPIPVSTDFKGFSFWVMCRRLFLHARKMDPDILHAHTGNSKMASVLVGELLKKPVVFTQHFLRTRTDHAFILHKPFSFCHLQAHKRIKRIIAVSDCVAAGMRNRDGCDLKNMEVIPLGIKEREASNVPNCIQSPMYSSSQRIAYIGRLEPERQPELFIEALGMLNEWATAWEAYIIGEGSRLRACMQLSDKLKLSSKVTFLGWREDARDFMRFMDVLANPCAVESFGLSTLEAMSMGKPVVAVKGNGSSELIQDGVTGILTENSPLAFSGGILRLLNNPSLAMEMGCNGENRFHSHYTSKKMTSAIIATYQQALS